MTDQPTPRAPEPAWDSRGYLNAGTSVPGKYAGICARCGSVTGTAHMRADCDARYDARYHSAYRGRPRPGGAGDMTSDETRPDRDALREQIADALFVYNTNRGHHFVVHDGGYEGIAATAWAVLEPALAQRDAEIERLAEEVERFRAERDNSRGEAFMEQQAIHADLRAILQALNLGDHARPYSSHDVVQREVLPAIADLDEARRVIAAVEAMCDRADANPYKQRGVIAARSVRAALASGDQL